MHRMIMVALVVLAPVCVATAAKKPPKPQPRPGAFEELVKCRAVADQAARLQCYDRAAAALEAAADRRDILLVDRNQVRQTKRSLFGLDIPDFNIFGGGGEEEAEEIKSIESVVASALQDSQGRWIVKLQEGGTWTQTDNAPLALRPRPGQKVRVNRGALGSYMMSVNGQPAVRVKRQL